MFNPNASLDSINKMGKGTMVEHIGIVFTEIGESHLKAKMPVDQRTIQPYGLLHGGANVVLAETMGSVAATISVDTSKQYCVGLEINANHIKAVRSGYVHGTTTPIHVGGKTQVWQIDIRNDREELVCVSRITMAVLDVKK